MLNSELAAKVMADTPEGPTESHAMGVVAQTLSISLDTFPEGWGRSKLAIGRRHFNEFGPEFIRQAAIVFPGVPPEVLMGFALNGGIQSNTTGFKTGLADERPPQLGRPPLGGVVRQPFHELGLFGVEGGPREGPAPGPDSPWSRVARSDDVRRILGRAGNTQPGGWYGRNGLLDQIAIGLVNTRNHGRNLAGQLPAAIRPSSESTLWFVALAFMGFSAGDSGASQHLSRWSSELAAVSEPQRWGTFIRVLAQAGQSGQVTAQRGRRVRHHSPFWLVLRTLQKIEAGRLLTQERGGNVAFYEDGLGAARPQLHELITRLAVLGAPLPSAAQSLAADEYSEALSVRAGEFEVSNTPALTSHLPRRSPDLILRWNTVPDGATTVDIVLHLHGHSKKGPDMDLHQKLAGSGLDLGGPGGASGRGRPTLAILPRGNNRVKRNRQGQVIDREGYDFPALSSLGGLRRLIDYSLDKFGRHVGIAQVRRGRFILTAHSGGGSSAIQILEATHGSDLEPQEVHIFDALYSSNVGPLIRWAQEHIDRDGGRSPGVMPQDGGALRVLFRAHSLTAAGSLAVLAAITQRLRGKPAWLRDWYRVEVADVDHTPMPTIYGGLLLSDAHASLPRTRPATSADAPRAASNTPAHAQSLQAAECRIEGAIATCDNCVAHERRIRGGEPAHLASVPAELCYRGAPKQLEPAALQAYTQLVAAARTGGIEGDLLKLCSGYRNYEQQGRIWRRELLNALEKAGCTAAELACAGPAIDRTTEALRSRPMPHPRNAWPHRFGEELRQVHCTLSCNVTAVIERARVDVAVPGCSAHHTGRAVDLFVGVAPGQNNPIVTVAAAMEWQRRQPAYRWLVCNAQRFHFYPYNGEPWHWEYNPPVTAGQGEGTAWSSSLQSALPTPDQIQPAASSTQPYGPRWRNRRPPGLPDTARNASEAGAAYPWIEQIAWALVNDQAFVTTCRHLAQTESDGIFARPANIFEVRSSGQRPAGTQYVSAWGVFQFNRDAWRGLSGVAPTAFPWECTAYEELMRPLRKYAELWQEVTNAGGSTLDAARGVRLWQRTPTGYSVYLRRGREQGFAAAWQRVAADHRSPIDRWLGEAGVLPRAARSQALPGETGSIAFDQPSTTVRTPFPPAATACAEIVRVANAEANRWLDGRQQIQETDRRILSVLADYWRTGVGVNYSETELADPAFQALPNHAWSAAFISWVMRQAGLGAIFRRAAAHAVYIRWAIENRQQNRNNPFWAYRIGEVTPRIGDLLCKNRLGGRLTYDTIRPGDISHCDIVTEVHSDRIVTIGGNVSNSRKDGGSVMRRSVPLDANGHVVGREFIAIIRYEDRAPANP